MNNPKRVVLVGHCGPHIFMLKTVFGRALPEATSVSRNDVDALSEYRTSDSLLLVNRELNGGFDSPSGIELIQQVIQQDNPPAPLAPPVPPASPASRGLYDSRIGTGGNPFLAVHVWSQGLRRCYRTILVLIQLQNRNKNPRAGGDGVVQRMTNDR